jgi:hypothetical protein
LKLPLYPQTKPRLLGHKLVADFKAVGELPASYNNISGIDVHQKVMRH